MSDQHGVFHWNELTTKDVEAAKDYYAAVCGWEYDTMEMPAGGQYHVGTSRGRPLGGIMEMPSGDAEQGRSPCWMAYLAVDDVDKAVAHTRSAGGTVLRDVFEVPGVGRIALVLDPTGAEIGIMTPA